MFVCVRAALPSIGGHIDDAAFKQYIVETRGTATAWQELGYCFYWPCRIRLLPFLYDSTFYGMAGIISVAAVANSMITKADPKYHMKKEIGM